MRTLLAASVMIAATIAPLGADAHDLSFRIDAPGIGVRIGTPFGGPIFAPAPLPIFVPPRALYGPPVAYLHEPVYAAPGYFWHGQYRRDDGRDYRHDDFRRDQYWRDQYPRDRYWGERDWREHDRHGNRQDQGDHRHDRDGRRHD